MTQLLLAAAAALELVLRLYACGPSYFSYWWVGIVECDMPTPRQCQHECSLDMMHIVAKLVSWNRAGGPEKWHHFVGNGRPTLARRKSRLALFSM